jgi:hypothetical protein
MIPLRINNNSTTMNQRDLFPGFDVDCFMRKPIENGSAKKLLSAI